MVVVVGEKGNLVAVDPAGDPVILRIWETIFEETTVQGQHEHPVPPSVSGTHRPAACPPARPPLPPF